jgi:biopolymer transport protein TolR
MASVMPSASAQSPAMRRGVSVQLPVTSNAAPMPEADSQDAWIVAVTAEGSFYFGIDPVTPEGLLNQMKTRPRNRDQKLYIKADARVPFADVEKMFSVARVDFFESSVLLTSQKDSSAPGTMVPPKGLEVLLVPPAGSQSAEVQLINSGQQTPILKINNRQIPLANLQNMLTQIFQNQTQKVVQLKADGQLPLADVVHAIDACHSTGAKVVLPTPQL